MARQLHVQLLYADAPFKRIAGFLDHINSIIKFNAMMRD